MTIVLRQKITATTGNLTLTFSGFPQVTQTGSFLFLGIACQGAATTPAGWTVLASGLNGHLSVYYRKNAPSISTLVVTVPGNPTVGILAEYTGVDISSPIDNSNTSTASLTAPSGSVTTASILSTAPKEMFVAFISGFGSNAHVLASSPAIDFSAPTNGFSLETSLALGVATSAGAYPTNAIALSDLLEVATGSYTTGLTVTSDGGLSLGASVMISLKNPTGNSIWFGAIG